MDTELPGWRAAAISGWLMFFVLLSANALWLAWGQLCCLDVVPNGATPTKVLASSSTGFSQRLFDRTAVMDFGATGDSLRASALDLAALERGGSQGPAGAPQVEETPIEIEDLLDDHASEQPQTEPEPEPEPQSSAMVTASSDTPAAEQEAEDTPPPGGEAGLQI